MTVVKTVDRVFGNMQLCWNPQCHYGWPLGARTACRKCGWTKDGSPSMNGKTAYQIAIDTGHFKGTESEWRASLITVTSPPQVRGRGTTISRETGMNKLEARYAAHLEGEKKAGRIHDFKFQGVKLRLADNTHMNMDFLVLDSAGLVELHDCKGYWKKSKKVHVEDDFVVKLKVAAEMYPYFRFCIVWENEGWQRKDY